MIDITYKLENFEGPLDLLLHLIEKNKIDIYDIPIVSITNQYLEYVAQFEFIDMEIESSFLVMAATLLEIKSKMLLPLVKDEDDNEIDPREELIARLLEYKKYKNLGNTLSDIDSEAPEYILKKPTIPKDVATYIPEINYDELLKGVDLNKLNNVFIEVIKRKENSIDRVRGQFGVIQKEKLPLKDRIFELVDYLRMNRICNFRKLLEESTSIPIVVVTFLAVLELIKVGYIVVKQDNIYDDIYIEFINDNNTIDFENMEDS